MNDREFIQAFERCELLPTQFVHRDHIRMAWICLDHYGWDEGCVTIREGIKRFAAHLQVPKKYHETITLFWARVVWNRVAQSPGISNFQLFITTYPELLDKNLTNAYYSHECLFSDEARNHWVEPDLQALEHSREGG